MDVESGHGLLQFANEPDQASHALVVRVVRVRALRQTCRPMGLLSRAMRDALAPAASHIHFFF
jgi:hypothetical protein